MGTKEPPTCCPLLIQTYLENRVVVVCWTVCFRTWKTRVWRNHDFCMKFLQYNIWPSVQGLKLKHTWVMQQDSDLKHPSKSTSQRLEKNKMKNLEWPSQSPNLKPNWDALVGTCGRVRTILWRGLSQNSLTAMWKTHWQFSQRLDCSSCCRRCYNQLRSAITFLHMAIALDFFSPKKLNKHLETGFCVYSG